jgi:hypothetical protein
MAFQTRQGLYRPTRRVQGAINFLSAFVRVSRKILNAHRGSIAEIFIKHGSVNGAKSQYEEEEVECLPGVRKYVMEYLPTHDNVLANVERAVETISGEKSDWSWNGVKIVEFVRGEAGRWPQASRVNKVWNRPRC